MARCSQPQLGLLSSSMGAPSRRTRRVYRLCGAVPRRRDDATASSQVLLIGVINPLRPRTVETGPSSQGRPRERAAASTLPKECGRRPTTARLGLSAATITAAAAHRALPTSARRLRPMSEYSRLALSARGFCVRGSSASLAEWLIPCDPRTSPVRVPRRRRTATRRGPATSPPPRSRARPAIHGRRTFSIDWAAEPTI